VQSNSNKEQLIRIPIMLEMMDGSKMALSLISPRALLKLHELLNREELFIDVETLDGERFSIQKTAIKLVKNRVIPVQKDLQQFNDDKNGFDPHRILKVEKEASQEAIRTAYLTLVREYHPDRFASIDLPKEVHEYLTNMLRRINVAYDMVHANAA
jgi:DnaJ-domain-containing protein 1